MYLSGSLPFPSSLCRYKLWLLYYSLPLLTGHELLTIHPHLPPGAGIVGVSPHAQLNKRPQTWSLLPAVWFFQHASSLCQPASCRDSRLSEGWMDKVFSSLPPPLLVLTPCRPASLNCCFAEAGLGPSIYRHELQTWTLKIVFRFLLIFLYECFACIYVCALHM